MRNPITKGMVLLGVSLRFTELWNAKCDKNRVNLCAGHERKCVLVNVNAFTGTFMRT